MMTPILLAALPLLLIYLFVQLHYRRFKELAVFPQLKPSLIWGHMKALQEQVMRGAPNRHTDIVFHDIRGQLGNPPVFLLDLRPLVYPILVICNHEVAEQISKVSKTFPWSVPKSPTMKTLVHLIGPHSILSAEGEQWKSLRKRFNPGFAPQHLITLLPCILDKTWHFLHNLDSYVRTGEEFHLGELCINLTFDIIGAVTMDLDFGAQLNKNRQSEVLHLFNEVTASYSRGGGVAMPWSGLITVFRRRKLSKRLDFLIKGIIKEKYAELRNSSHSGKKFRSILSLSLQDADTLTPAIIDQTCDQLKTFLFAGHDTTSILLQWIFYELSRTPRVLAKLRAELDEIFGQDPDPRIVRHCLLSPDGEELLHRMSYASAVIKEALRLYPPAGTARMMPKGSGFTLRLRDGKEMCLDGMVLYNCATIIQRDEAVYGETKDDFVPERWLGNSETGESTNADGKGNYGEGTPIPTGAWRPFERGPRSCIGQELANIEVRLVLACAARRYDFTKVGLGELALDENGQPILNTKGQYEVKSQLYNTQQVTAKPVDGTRMTVKLSPKSLTKLL